MRLAACKEIPILARLLGLAIPKSVHEKRKQHLQHSSERVDKRLAMETTRPDIWTYVLRNTNKDEDGMTLNQMYSCASTFMIAGTETTATQLSGLTYLLLKNPETMKKLTAEIRGAFSSQSDIQMQTLAQLDYLNAALEEGLRFYPPVPVAMPRIVPASGAVVCDHFVPAGVSFLSWFLVAS
jgi:cytochrome P450